jgi:type VI secretion system secreted protein Hcp
MATNFILEIDGVKGESKAKGHTDHIDIYSWSTGISQSGSYAAGGGGGTGKPIFQDLHFTKEIECASNQLQLRACGHDHIKKAVLHCYVMGKNNVPMEYMKITLEDALVASYSISGGGDGKPTEQFSLNFAKYKFEYAPQKEDQTMDSFKSFSWNLKEGVKA